MGQELQNFLPAMEPGEAQPGPSWQRAGWPLRPRKAVRSPVTVRWSSLQSRKATRLWNSVL